MNLQLENAAVAVAPHARACGACSFTKPNDQQTISPRRTGIIAEFLNAFPAVMGHRFWPRVRQLLGIVLLVAVLRSTVADVSLVPSGSMIPTLLVGDLVFVNKLAYDLKVPFTTIDLIGWADPRRGAVVVFFSPTTGIRLAKRIVGLPGDAIELRNNVLSINGRAATYDMSDPDDRNHLGSEDLIGDGRGDRRGDRRANLNDSRAHQLLMETTHDFTPLAHSIMETPDANALRSFARTIVPSGSYFMMGDNRDDSFDSRYFGFVPRSQIIGRACRVIFSFSGSGVPRMKRVLVPIQ